MFFYLPPSFLLSSISAFPLLVRQQMIRVGKRLEVFYFTFLLLNRYFSLSRKEENSTSTKYSQFGVWYIYILTNTLLTHKKSKVFYVDYIKMHEKLRCLCHKFYSEIIFNIFLKELK